MLRKLKLLKCFWATAAGLLCWAQLGTLSAQTLVITSPIDGTVVNPGQTLSVAVAASPGAVFQSVIVGGTDPIGFSDSVGVPPYQFSIPVPSNAQPGKYTLTADGILGPGQGASSPSITLLVERPDNPTSLAVAPGIMNFQLVGDECPLRVEGTFPDGSSSDVTESSYISYQSDTPAVAAVDADGYVTAVGPGSANITATYKGVSTTISVTVSQPLSLVPAVASVYASQTTRFFAQINMDPSVSQAVVWSISPQLGSIDQTGLYTAPASLPSWQGVTVTATSVADPTKSASAQVWVFPPTAVSITPGTASLSAAQSQLFTARVTNADAGVIWSISPDGMGSLISSSGVDSNYKPIALGTYYAPGVISSPQTVTITAISISDNSKSASVSVNLTPSVAVNVTPATASLSASQSQQFTATLNFTSSQATTWTISPQVGSISATGLYSAPSAVTSTQTIAVTATNQAPSGMTYSGTATITLAAAQPVITLYVPNSNNAPPSISGYTINPTTGALTAMSGSGAVFDNNPTRVAMTPNGKFLYASSHNGYVDAYTVSPSGSLTTIKAQPGYTVPGPFGMVATNSFLYVTSGSSSIAVFSIDATTGALTQLTCSACSTGAGSYPQNIVLDPTGTYLYVALPGTNSIGVGTLAQSGPNAGTLSSFVNAYTGPSSGSSAFTPQDVALSPNGSYLYASNFVGPPPGMGTTYITPFTVSGTTVTAGTNVTVGNSANGLAIDPSGRFLFVANQGSGNVSAFTIGGGGALGPVPGSPFASGSGASSQPAGASVDPSGNFLYISNQADRTVSGFQITQSGANAGALTPVGPPVATGTAPYYLLAHLAPQ